MAESTETAKDYLIEPGILGNGIFPGLMPQNNESPKLIVRNTITGKLEERDVSTLPGGTVPTLDQVLSQGNSSARTIFIDDGEGNTTILASEYISLKSASGAGTWSTQAVGDNLVYMFNGTPKFAIAPNGNLTIANNDSFVGTFDPSNITENKIYQLPNNDGELALKELTVPLSGTEEDKPITGNIELQDGIQLLSETDTYMAYIQPNLEGSGEFVISLMNKTNNKTSYLVFDENQVGLNLYDGVTNYGFSLVNGQVNVNLPLASRGITSTVDYTPNIQSLDYTQKKYVDRNSIKRLFSTGSAGITTTGAETIAYAVPVKASDIGEGVMTFETILSKVGGAGNGTIRVYRSNSATSVSGALQLMTFTTSSSQRTVPIKRDNIILRNGTNQSLIYSTTTAASTEGNSSSNLENINYDFSVDHFILFTVTSSSGDTIRLESLKVLFYKNV